jgi:hypothetical protein
MLTGSIESEFGVDGDLHGLVPERTVLPEAAHIVVDGVTATTTEDWTSGTATLTAGVYTASSPSRAITLAGRMAQYVQDQLNPGFDETVNHSVPTEGNVCRINVMPGDYSLEDINFNDNTLNWTMLSDQKRISWVRNWVPTQGAPDKPNNGRAVRDIVFIGMGTRIDSVLFPRIEFKFTPDNGSYPGQVDNVRFENMRIQNSGQRETIFGGTNMIGDMNDHPNANGSGGPLIGDMEPISAGNGWTSLGGNRWQKTQAAGARFRYTAQVTFAGVRKPFPRDNAGLVLAQGEWFVDQDTNTSNDLLTIYWDGVESVDRSSDMPQGQSNFITDRAPLASDGADYDVWRDTSADRLYYKLSSGWVDQGDFTARFSKERYQGVIKFYDCEIRGRENTSAYMGTGQKQAIRMQAYGTGLDLRNVKFFAAQEHSVYDDNPQLFLYMVNCYQASESIPCPAGSPGGISNSISRVGNGNTFVQLASRLIRHPGHHPDINARVVLIRNTMQGNLTTHGIGGYDFTCWGGFDGEIHLIDCGIIGTAAPWGPENPDPGTGNSTAGPGFSTSNSRGGVNMTQEAGYDGSSTPNIAKGATVFETFTGSGVWYSTRKLVVSGLNFDTDGNRRSTNNLRCCKEIEYGFTNFRSSSYKAQFQMNGDQAEGGASVPYRPNLSFAWGAELRPTASASPPFLAGDGSSAFGFDGTATVKVDHRSTLDSSDSGRVTLSDPEIDVYNGTDPA